MKRYNVDLSDRFKKEFRKLDKYTQRMIRAWINNNLVMCGDPRLHGKAIAGDLRDQWRYRIGCYRLICEIRDKELVILALTVGHGRHVYEG